MLPGLDSRMLPTVTSTRNGSTFIHLDATTVLARSLAAKGIYPAVDVLESTSTMLQPWIVGDAHSIVWAHEHTRIANLVYWKDKPVALSIVQARLVGLAHFSIGYVLTYGPLGLCITVWRARCQVWRVVLNGSLAPASSTLATDRIHLVLGSSTGWFLLLLSVHGRGYGLDMGLWGS